MLVKVDHPPNVVGFDLRWTPRPPLHQPKAERTSLEPSPSPKLQDAAQASLSSSPSIARWHLGHAGFSSGKFSKKSTSSASSSGDISYLVAGKDASRVPIRMACNTYNCPLENVSMRSAR